MAEIWGLAIASVAGAVVGGVIQGDAAKSAASTQAGAAENAQNISQNEFNTITGQEQPFMNLGYGAGNELGYLLGLPGYQNQGGGGAGGPPGNVGPGGSYGPVSGVFGGLGNGSRSINSVDPGANAGRLTGLLNQSGPGGGINPTQTGPAPRPGAPGSAGMGGNPAGGFGSLVTPFTSQNWQQLSPMYNFNVQQGRQGVLNSDASQQGALSGSAAKDLINYNQSAANNSFGQAFNQYQTQQGNIFSRLSGIAQLGQNAAANTGMQGTQLAGQAAQSATNVGTALAGGQVGAANAYSGAISSALPWLYANQQSASQMAPSDYYTTPGG